MRIDVIAFIEAEATKPFINISLFIIFSHALTLPPNALIQCRIMERRVESRSGKVVPLQEIDTH